MLDALMPVPFQSIIHTFTDASMLLGDRTIGARIGVAMPAQAFGPYMAFALAANDLAGVVSRAQAYSRLHTNGVASHLMVHGARATWRLTYAIEGTTDLDNHALHIIVPLIAVLREFGDRDADQIAVHIVSGYAPDARAIEAIVGSRVVPRSSAHAVSFPAAWLRRRRPAPKWAEDVSLDALPQYLQVPLPTSLVDAVRHALAGRPLEDTVDLESIAAELGRAGRTLQHGLACEGVSYRDIVRNVRIERAIQMLAESNRPIAEIAQHVGYTDQANFHRAFVAVTGATPKQHRKASRS
ncbi:AraC family transcriptional regulator [Polymorphobacter arshaanensis]|uniref:AraC family transcriptional regulator n=1 Tax=Glacieibacterium arshaanense TaxID=2511025 RepID=A0A4Y9EPW8_9SPHN|nr:AraC family transcriptional regulator [Polymorphobacter arshaanensis]